MSQPGPLEDWPDTAQAPDDAITVLHDLQVRCHAQESPLLPARSGEEALGWFRSPPSDETRSLWLARDEHGAPVGAAWLSCQANRTAVAEVMVEPSVRSSGVGTRLYDAVVAAAREAGMGTLTGTTASRPAQEFLVRRGAVAGHVRVRQVLDLHPRVPVPTPPVVESVGPSVRSWEAPTPTPLLAAYALAKDAINDAPGEGFDREVWTPERIASLEQTIAARGSSTLVSAVVLDGVIIAYTEIRVPRPPGTTAATQDTAVVVDHRRHGYGALVKRASLAHLRDQRPDVRLVTTTNDASNEPMLRINRTLGFVAVSRQTQFSLRL